MAVPSLCWGYLLMRTAATPFALAVLLPLLACAPADPWVEWPVTDATMSDLAITRVAWDQGEGTEPGPDGQARYAWALDIENTSTTIWSGRVTIITEWESGGQVFADTLRDQVVIPGRRVLTATNFGRLGAGVEGVTPRFRVRIGAYCATIQGESAESGPCPEEPAATEPPTDVGPPIG
ncbi:MAG: hypothetical protein ABR551_00005 [Gemmatimonadales bacterium]